MVSLRVPLLGSFRLFLFFLHPLVFRIDHSQLVILHTQLHMFPHGCFAQFRVMQVKGPENLEMGQNRFLGAIGQTQTLVAEILGPALEKPENID